MKSLVQNLRELPLRADGQDWQERVAREVERQARIEAAFDRADACRLAAHPEQALAWLAQAEALGGELPPAYQATRVHLSRELAGQGVGAGSA